MNESAQSGFWRRFSGWLAAAVMFAVLGGVAEAAQTGAAAPHAAPPWIKAAGYSYLTAYMFFLSLCLGGLFLVLIHHLFDAMWSVPTRRFCEHMACLLCPWMLVLFLPILANVLLAGPENLIYEWMDPAKADHALHAKHALFNKPAFVLVSLALFGIWGWLTHGLRRHSLAQDKTGAAGHTRAMRKYAAGGIFIFAFSLTLACIFWMKSLMHQFFSTMYGVYYFAGSVWTTMATVYVITLILKKRGPLASVAGPRQFHDIGVLFFAFTVFYAYIHFSQYFLIWNAAIPEETFWYVLREKGGWWWIGMLIIFGHFFVPFLTFLRIDTKLNAAIMVPFAAWAWLMHYLDMTYNVMPKIYPDGPRIGVFDVLSLAVIGGVLINRFFAAFNAHPPYPQKDPRIAETMGVYVDPAKGPGAAH
ncbi:MAG: hypothetical protein FJ386_09110 [Verrucomicrobia bacterium]|nr:hypothetical protein [Verrucomicrobiota bacterium]